MSISARVLKPPTHILQSCPTFDDMRRQTWPSPVDAHRKLWGPVETLRQTRARRTLQLSPIVTRNTGPATIAGLPAANPQGLQAVCRAIGRISIPARKLQCCSQSQRGISYDPMAHSLSKWEVTDCPARVLLIWNGIARGPVQSCNVCREHCDLDCNLW